MDIKKESHTPTDMKIEYKSKDGIVLSKKNETQQDLEEIEDIDIRKKIIIKEIESDIELPLEEDITPRTK